MRTLRFMTIIQVPDGFPLIPPDGLPGLIEEAKRNTEIQVQYLGGDYARITGKQALAGREDWREKIINELRSRSGQPFPYVTSGMMVEIMGLTSDRDKAAIGDTMGRLARASRIMRKKQAGSNAWLYYL